MLMVSIRDTQNPHAEQKGEARMSASRTEQTDQGKTHTGEVQISGERLMAYWRMLEMLQAQYLPSLDPRVFGEGRSVIVVEGGQGKYPWELAAHSVEPHSAQENRHIVYVGVFTSKTAFELIGRGEPAELEAADFGRYSYALCALHVDNDGYTSGSFRLSTAAWGVSSWLRGIANPDDFNAACSKYAAYAEAELSGKSLHEIGPRISALFRHVVEELGLQDLFVAREIRHRVETLKARHAWVTGEVALNSIHLEDLSARQLDLQRGEVGEAFKGFVGESRPVIRLDLDTVEGVDVSLAALVPSWSNIAKWPDADKPSRSELLAANLVRKELKPAGGLQAIELPQGASEYRVIREIVLDNLVFKADTLSAFPRSAMVFTRTLGGNGALRQPVWEVYQELQHTGIAVVYPNSVSLDDLCSQLGSCVREAESEPDPIVRGLLQIGTISANVSSRRSRRNFYEKYICSEGGMVELLNQGINNPLPREEHLSMWSEACERYSRAKKKVQAYGDLLHELPGHLRELRKVRAMVSGAERSVAISEKWLAEYQKGLLTESDDEHVELHRELSDVMRDLSASPEVKQGFLDRFRRQGGSGHSHQEALKSRVQDLGSRLTARVKTIQTQKKILRCQQETLWQMHAEMLSVKDRYLQLLEKVMPYCEQYSLTYLREWIETASLSAPEVEHCTGWVIDGYEQAQEEVFREALRLHAVFLRLEGGRLLNNLQLGLRLLDGNHVEDLTEERRRSIWASVHLVVPVMVMNTANVPTTFRTVCREGFEWVIQCDSGMVAPASAVPLVYRGRNVVMLGDRNHYLNGTLAPQSVRRKLAKYFGVDPRHAELNASSMLQAEDCSAFGAFSGPPGRQEWSGIPIRSIDASPEPMLSILEKGIYGRRLSRRIAPAGELDGFDSGWIDIRGAASGNWIPQEGVALLRLLDILLTRGVETDAITVATISGRGRNEAMKLLQHTGFEVRLVKHLCRSPRDYVIMVLGGGSAVWRDSASRHTALIANPVASARKGIFVIGDRADWSRRGLMKVLAEHLPRLSVDICAPFEVISTKATQTVVPLQTGHSRKGASGAAGAGVRERREASVEALRPGT